MAQEEQILVIQRSLFDELGAFNGLMFDVDKYLPRIFASGATRFMNRSDAEKDPSYKQIIPYVIMSHNGKFLSYVRGKKAGEKRLLGLRSIGIGGHINPIDCNLFTTEPYEIYLESVKREIDEEVIVETKHKDKIAALLNDDSNEVGQVHLGIVHLWSLDEPKVNKREQMITQMGFMSLDELKQAKESMETWSGLCVDHLEKMSS